MSEILVLNAGSSSIKFAAFEPSSANDSLQRSAHGRIATAGDAVGWHVQTSDGAPTETSTSAMPAEGFDHDGALDRVLAWFGDRLGGLAPAAVGHRVVHGGERFAAPVVVTEEVLRELEGLVPLAPLHQPHNLKPMAAVRRRWPGVPQIACFDTAFHTAQPAVARAFALPRELTDAGVRRYGFHGLSYEYVATQLPRVLGPAASGKVVVAHLGNGASLCGVANGRSVATTMGFSVLDGLVMGTRCGALDAGVLLYLMAHHRYDAARLSDLLYHRSGLLGVSGLSSDMPVLLESHSPHAAEAIELFVHRIVVEIGGLAAAMGGIDALVFTAGIGEHAAAVRARIVAGCAWLGARLDDDANAAGHALIHAPDSRLQLAVVPTDEERMIAIHTLALLR